MILIIVIFTSCCVVKKGVKESIRVENNADLFKLKKKPEVCDRNLKKKSF